MAAERSAVVAGDSGGVAAARECGFAYVVGLDQEGHPDELLHCGADVVVADLSDVMVRTGDECMSRRPNALDSYGQVIGMVSGRQPFVCVNYDSTLSEIVPDPDLATLVDGAAEALADLSMQCPVAMLSGRDLADIRNRVGLPGIWYAGSHGFDLMAPDGTRYQHDAAAAAVPVMASAATTLQEELGPTSGAHVEHTRFGVRVHYGKVAHEQVPDVIAAAHRQSRRHGLRLITGRGVVELRPDVDWDKGTALAWIRDHVIESGSNRGRNRAGCCRSTSVATSPTRTPSMRCGSAVSGSWSATTATVTAHRRQLHADQPHGSS
ncbi:trehalose-phosphatase [Mycobacterium kansasii]|uniref:Trehalose 6-phosphate phosphatase n=1 Tax=Mycobacterium kansasii TaxID=1768 RepID=A0A1V3WHK8_MYCKA|nr:trehalose-phosphatase [Mycobacterium kansasii]